MTTVVRAAVFPGHQPTSAWAWVVICVWFFGVPLVVGAFGLYTKLTGNPPPGLASEEEEEAQGSS